MARKKNRFSYPRMCEGTLGRVRLADRLTWVVDRGENNELYTKLANVLSITWTLDTAWLYMTKELDIKMWSLVSVSCTHEGDYSKVTICNHHADSQLLCVARCLIWWLRRLGKVWSYMTPNALTETRCHLTTQTKLFSGLCSLLKIKEYVQMIKYDQRLVTFMSGW